MINEVLDKHLTGVIYKAGLHSLRTFPQKSVRLVTQDTQKFWSPKEW